MDIKQRAAVFKALDVETAAETLEENRFQSSSEFD